MNYIIQLEQFEGPFDLLLFFIQRDELDIHDIPISKITNDFLDYIHQLERLNIDVASEFILVAAKLMRIKSRLLIPRADIDEEGNEIDPRQDLVNRLIEYKRFKETLKDFSALEENRSRKKYRGNLTSEVQKLAQRSLIDSELESLTLYKLLQAFQRTMEKLEDREKRLAHEVAMSRFTLEEERESLRNHFADTDRRYSFSEVFANCKDKLQAIVRFLALLDLLTHGGYQLRLGEGVNNFWLEAGEEEE